MTDFDRAYRENAELVYRYVFSLTRNADMAEEVTQQTFYEASGIRGITGERRRCPPISAGSPET